MKILDTIAKMEKAKIVSILLAGGVVVSSSPPRLRLFYCDMGAAHSLSLG